MVVVRVYGVGQEGRDEGRVGRDWGMVGLWYGWVGCMGWGKRVGMRAGWAGIGVRVGFGYGWVPYGMGCRGEGRDEGRVGRDWGWDDLWTFRDLDFSRVVLSRPMVGPFATRYFSHLFDPRRFATSVIFAVCCQLTVNYSLTIRIRIVYW